MLGGLPTWYAISFNSAIISKCYVCDIRGIFFLRTASRLSLSTTFNLETRHFNYRYKVFGGFFPTTKWLLSPHADVNNPVAQDIYVFFSYSDDPNSIIPHDTLAVELATWTRVIADANREH